VTLFFFEQFSDPLSIWRFQGTFKPQRRGCLIGMIWSTWWAIPVASVIAAAFIYMDSMIFLFTHGGVAVFTISFLAALWWFTLPLCACLYPTFLQYLHWLVSPSGRLWSLPNINASFVSLHVGHRFSLMVNRGINLISLAFMRWLHPQLVVLPDRSMNVRVVAVPPQRQEQSHKELFFLSFPIKLVTESLPNCTPLKSLRRIFPVFRAISFNRVASSINRVNHECDRMSRNIRRPSIGWVCATGLFYQGSPRTAKLFK